MAESEAKRGFIRLECPEGWKAIIALRIEQSSRPLSVKVANWVRHVLLTAPLKHSSINGSNSLQVAGNKPGV